VFGEAEEVGEQVSLFDRVFGSHDIVRYFPDCPDFFRDQLASRVMTAYIGNNATLLTCAEKAAKLGLTLEAVVAQECYAMADAMLAERTKEHT
jgi:hypothetical protein